MNDCPPPVLISLGMMPSLFGVAQQTAHRWNTTAGGPGRLPPPDLVLDSMPLWFEDTVLVWACTRRKRLVVDEAALGRIRVSQLSV